MISLINNPDLVDVIRRYEIRVASIDSYPLFHLLKTDRGTKVLTVWNDLETLKNSYRFKESLAKSGFRKINRFIKTKDYAPYVENQGIGYSLTDLVNGMTPTATRSQDIDLIGSTLAEFHTALENSQPDQPFELWSRHFNQGLEHLKKVEKELNEKTNKQPLDIKLLKDMPKHLEQVKQSILMAKKVEKNAFKNGLNVKWCHGNPQISSFRVDEYGEGWLIDLTVPVVDVPAYDLAKLIIRIYKKSGYNHQLMQGLLENYQKAKQLTIEDKLWLLTYIAYPHDIWKFIYVYYRVKIPQPEEINEQYTGLIEQQINLGSLYQFLFTYFAL